MPLPTRGPPITFTRDTFMAVSAATLSLTNQLWRFSILSEPWVLFYLPLPVSSYFANSSVSIAGSQRRILVLNGPFSLKLIRSMTNSQEGLSGNTLTSFPVGGEPADSRQIRRSTTFLRHETQVLGPG